MSEKYQALAQTIVKHLGGSDNIVTLFHCQTRLRFTLVDLTKVNQTELQNTPGVIKTISSDKLFQVVIGPHVPEVFAQVEKVVGVRNKAAEVPAEKNKNIVLTIIDFISGSFMPVLPALCGAGMVKAVLALLTVFKLVSAQSQTYIVLNFISGTVFTFLPIFLAFNAARKLGSSPMLAVATATMLLNPTWIELVKAGEPVYLFDIIPLQLANYANSVIPILIIVFVQSYVEKFFDKVIPAAVKIVFVPLFTFLIIGTLAFSLLGPIGVFLGGYMAAFFNFLNAHAHWASSFLMGAFQPLFVMFGVHTAIAPIGLLQIAEQGYDSIFGPGALVSNMAMAGAGVVMAIRSRDTAQKQIATTGAITAYMGITEPLLYGILLPRKYPLVAALLGGGIAGLYIGVMGVHRFSAGGAGLPAVLLYIDDSLFHFYNIIIGAIISTVSAAVICYFFSMFFERKAAAQAAAEIPAHNPTIATVGAVTTNTNNVVSATEVQAEEILAPLAGKLRTLDKSPDPAFADGDMGQGVVIEPSVGRVVAPFAGVVSALFPTKHALVLRSDKGTELLIHVGIDTVELNGQGFIAHVAQGDRFAAGQLLLEVDLQLVSSKGYQTSTPIIVMDGNLDTEFAVNYETMIEPQTPIMRTKV